MFLGSKYNPTQAPEQQRVDDFFDTLNTNIEVGDEKDFKSAMAANFKVIGIMIMVFGLLLGLVGILVLFNSGLGLSFYLDSSLGAFLIIFGYWLYRFSNR